MSARPYASLERPRGVPAAERLAAWREVIGQVRQLAGAIIDSGGADAAAWSPELLRGLHELKRLAFPIEGACGPKASQAFHLWVEALHDALLPARRAALAEGVLGSVAALEGLIHAEHIRLTAEHAKRLGAGG